MLAAMLRKERPLLKFSLMGVFCLSVEDNFEHLSLVVTLAMLLHAENWLLNSTID